MSKAFALKDFDTQRILQRRFFKDFHFDADKTDEEILQSLQEIEKKSLDALEQSQKTIKATYERLEAFHALLNRHQTRLGQFNKVKAATDSMQSRKSARHTATIISRRIGRINSSTGACM